MGLVNAELHVVITEVIATVSKDGASGGCAGE